MIHLTHACAAGYLALTLGMPGGGPGEPEPTETVDPTGAFVETLAPSRGGQEILATRFEPLKLDRWIDRDPAMADRPSPAPDRVTLYRWWTDSCPYCRSSLPAMEQLRVDFADRNLDVVAVYHPKPVRKVTDAEVRDAAEQIGYHGTIAVDERWSELRRQYLSRTQGPATSVSILVDADGNIRFVHPGPDLFPSDDPAQTRQHADYELLRQAVEAITTSRTRPK